MLKRPRKFFFKKSFRKYLKNTVLKKPSFCNLVFGDFGLKCLENNWMRYIHFQILRLAVVRVSTKRAKVWFRFSLNIPITRHSRNARMGKGKGSLKSFAAGIAKGSIVVEFSGVNTAKANEIFHKLSKALPSKVFLLKSSIRNF